MAKKGLAYVAFAKYHYTNGTTTYTDGIHPSTAVTLNASITHADVTDYGDDRAVETDTSPTSGSISVELNNDEDVLYTYLRGATTQGSGTAESIVSNVDDDAPYVAVAGVGKSGSNYVAKVYVKCQFSEPNDDNTTRTDTPAFGHITMPGKILIPEDGTWRIRKTFSTLAAAIAWIGELFNVA
jgi:phi13 family phage major tail protein